MRVTGKDVPGTCILPPGTATVLSGPRASGKTWVAAAWMAQEIIEGNHVIWADFERQGYLLAQKFRALLPGSHLMETHLHYASGTVPETSRLIADVTRWAAGGKRVFLVIDAFRSLQGTTAPGTSASDGDAVEAVYLEVLNPAVEAGATVVLIDHVSKAGATGTFGSERKESAADYVLRVDQVTPFSRDRAGYSRVTVTKDRYGYHAAGSVAGYLWMPAGNGKAEGIREYPEKPELRNWSPDGQGTLEGAATGTKEKRVEEAVAAFVAMNPLQFNQSSLAKVLCDASPELYGDNAESLRRNYIVKMVADGKLAKEPSRFGKLSVPVPGSVPVTSVRPEDLLGEDHDDARSEG